ncbi:G patch domain protein isoform X2 [Carex rostrata]
MVIDRLIVGFCFANRAVEVDEMWRAREKERELETKHRSRSKERSKYHSESSKGSSSHRSEHEKGNQVTSCSSRNPDRSDCYSDEDRSGLQDDEIEQFLRSRVKRGRGEIGSRMDEPGPYLTSMHHVDYCSNVRGEDKQKRRALGPEKPLFLKSSSSEKSTKESSSSKDKKRKEKKERHKHKKKRREERSKHSHKSRRSE